LQLVILLATLAGLQQSKGTPRPDRLKFLRVGSFGFIGRYASS